MPNSRLRAALIGLTCTAALGILAGCGGSSSAGTASSSSSGSAMDSSSMSSMGASTGSTAGSSAAASAVVIHIEKFAYQTPVSVSPGATVTVMNMDGEAHTVTADSGSAFDVKAAPGASTTFTAPTKPGTYAFHCKIHSTMHGTLVVR
jgi:plastocyanin